MPKNVRLESGPIPTRGSSYDAAEYLREMTLIRKSGSDGSFQNADGRIAKKLTRTVYPAAKHELMRRDLERLFEQFRKVVWTHFSSIRQCTERYASVEVRLDVVENSAQPDGRQTILRSEPLRRHYSVAVAKMNCKSREQRLSEEPSSGKSGFRVRFQGAKYEPDLWVLYSPLVPEFERARCIFIRESTIQDRRLEIEQKSPNGSWKRHCVLGAAGNQNDCARLNDDIPCPAP